MFHSSIFKALRHLRSPASSARNPFKLSLGKRFSQNPSQPGGNPFEQADKRPDQGPDMNDMADLFDQQMDLEALKNDLVESKKDSADIQKMMDVEHQIGIPYKLHGVQKLPKDRPYFMFSRMLIQHQIPNQFIMDY
jgi:hypothetical protein